MVRVTADSRTIVIDARALCTSTGRYIERLLHYLQLCDTVNQYVILLKPCDFEAWVPTSPRFSVLICPYRQFSFGEQLGMWRQLRSLGADLVHFPMPQQPVLYGGAVVSTILDLTTARFVHPDKGRVVFFIKQLIYRLVVRRVATASRHVITVSGFVKRDLEAFADIDGANLSTIYLAADRIEAAPEPLALVHDRRFILTVGNAQPHKNVLALIEAFALLHAANPGLALVVAGPDDALMARLVTQVKVRGLDAGVIFAGFVSDGQLRWLYEHASAYVFPSLSEGFGLPGLEAMVHGAPVLASSTSCLPEIYRDAAHYFMPTDTASMAAAIREVLDDPALAARLVEAGHRVSAGYGWHRCAEQTLAVYRSVLEIAP